MKGKKFTGKSLCLKCKKRTECLFLKQPGYKSVADCVVKCVEFEEIPKSLKENRDG